MAPLLGPLGILTLVCLVSSQNTYFFSPRQPHQQPRPQFYDPLHTSQSIQTNSFSNSFGGPSFNSAPEVSSNGIDGLFQRVIQEAEAFVENAERPAFGFNASMHHPHHAPNPHAVGSHGFGGTHGMGSHNYCKFTAKSKKIGQISIVHIKAYEMLTKNYQVPKTQALNYLRNRLPSYCKREEAPVFCDANARYRTFDGRCNNLNHPWWGASYTEFDRLAPAIYEDGWNEPRGGGMSLSNRLPNARIVSLSVHPDYVHPDSRMTNMVPQFGQFLDHDMTLTPEADRRCCSRDANNVECFNIRIPTDDYFYSKLNSPQSCMDFTRSTAFCFPSSPNPSATVTREQMNIVTAYVDASHVYASEENRTRLLREFRNGRLKTNLAHPGFLPTVKQIQMETGEDFEFMGTFYGGEERVNEMPGLTVMHTLLFREHNRLAGLIQSKRPYWDDETIFQEARRILIAEWQSATYGEYLPVILGPVAMRKYGLELEDQSQYNANLNPTIFHAFADAAYRFGHTLLNGMIRMMRGFQDIKNYKVRDNFFSHEQITWNGGEGYDLILGGLLAQNAQTYDPFVTEDVTNFLLKTKAHDFGGDLIARNLQRAREHGLPSYNVYRTICGLSGLTNSWVNRPKEIAARVWDVLGSLYETPLDIDLFTGGLGEVSVEDGVTGPTFNCLKAVQFVRTKFGDRFFFTHTNSGFTVEQIREIRKRTFGDMVCANSHVEMTPKNVFKMPSEQNTMIRCDDPSRNRFNIDVFLYDRR